jgi:hypothetical protein
VTIRDDLQLSEHFHLSELSFSQTAARLGIDNNPPEWVVTNLKNALAPGLEAARLLLGGRPILVSSGYRCPALNTRVGGSGKSKHMLGLAADVTCPGYGSPYDVAVALRDSSLQYDELILEFGRWVHVAFPYPGPAARKTLTIASPSSGYQQGIHRV